MKVDSRRRLRGDGMVRPPGARRPWVRGPSSLPVAVMAVATVYGGGFAWCQDGGDRDGDEDGPGVEAPAGSVQADPADMTAGELLAAADEAWSGEDYVRAGELFAQWRTEYGANAELRAAAVRVLPLLALCRVRSETWGEETDDLIREAMSLTETPPAEREELRFWSGIAALRSERYDEAEEAFRAFYGDPAHDRGRRIEAVVLEGTARLMAGRMDEAAEHFGRHLERLRAERPEAASRAAVLRLHALIEAGRLADALAVVREEFPRIGEMVQVAGFHSMALRLGAALLEQGDAYGAVACLQRIWRRERLVAHQHERLEDLRAELEAQIARRDAADLVHQSRAMIRSIEREVEQIQAIEGFDAAVRLRLAAAFQQLERWREAALLLEDLARRHEAPGEEAGLEADSGALRCWMQAGAWKRAIDAADRVESRCGETRTLRPILAEALYFRAEARYELAEHEAAAADFGRVAREFAGKEDGNWAIPAAFMEGMALLQADRSEEAVRLLEGFVREHPGHALAEDALYWQAMGLTFAAEHAAARTVLERYLEAHPEGGHVDGAVFRRAFCLFADAWYDEAAREFRAFFEAHPDSMHVDEARLLLGDALCAVGEIEAGLASYASIRPDSGHYFEDGWFKTANAYRVTGRPTDMREHLETFIERFPASSRAAEAVFGIGRALRAEGREDEAREAYWQAIQVHGDGPENLGVEQILLALPGFYRAGSDGGLGPLDLGRELERVEREAAMAGRETLRLRCLWARGRIEEARSADLARTALLEAALLVRPEIHSPTLAVDCADARRAADAPKVAEELYRGARKWNPRGPELDRIHFGLARVALVEGRAAEAEEHLRRALAAAVSSDLRAEILLARSELEQERRGTRAARESLEELLGDATIGGRWKARALIVLGRLLEREGERRRAAAFYERVYVGYAKFRDATGTAYAERARLLEELDEPAKALEVYRELLDQEDLAVTEHGRNAAERVRKLETLTEPPEPDSGTNPAAS